MEGWNAVRQKVEGSKLSTFMEFGAEQDPATTEWRVILWLESLDDWGDCSDEAGILVIRKKEVGWLEVRRLGQRGCFWVCKGVGIEKLLFFWL